MTTTTRPGHTCGGCNNTWTGLTACHCAAQCHQTFGGIKSFDRHRAGGVCRAPTQMGLRYNQHRRIWSEPFSWQRDDNRETGERLEDLMAAFRNARPDHRGKTKRPTDEERAADQAAADAGTLPRRTINIHAEPTITCNRVGLHNRCPHHNGGWANHDRAEPDHTFLGWLSFGDVEDGGWIGPE